MTRVGHCFDSPSSEADGEIEETDFVRGQKVFEDERRRSMVSYLEKLKCDRVRRMETNVCNHSAVKNQPRKIRRSNEVIRRSSAALVKSRRVPVEDSCCCSDSASPEPPYCRSRSNVVHDCGGSILRGKTRATETQTSRSHSRHTFLGISRTKGTENWRTENMSKFSPVRENISSGFCDRLPSYGTPSSDKCCCFSNTRLKKPAKNYQKIRFHPQDHFPARSNDCVITTASTSEGEIIDYQVPVHPCSSSHRFYETGSETKTLVPTPSHVTIRICSQNSSSSLQCEKFDAEEDDRPRLSRSENSLNHLEDRVRRGLRAMCCCDNPRDDNLEEEFDDDEVSLKPGYSSVTECQISTPRSRRKSCCCKCRENSRPMIGFVQSSDEGSFQRFKDVLTETRRRRGHRRHSTCHSNAEKNSTRSERTMCGPKRPRRVVSKRISNPVKNNDKELAACIDRSEDRNPFPDSPIILSTQKYKEFLNRCECIRKSSGNIINPGCKPAPKEVPVWEGDVMNLGDLKPDLPPLDHWSQYEDGMRKMANEYRALKSCVNLIEAESEKENPSCCCTEKSVTRTYPSGTEFTFRVKRVPDKEACQTFSGPVEEPSLVGGSKKSASIHRSQNFRAKSRSVCFEKSKREKQPCCDCPVEAKPRSNFSQSNPPANIEAIRSREADLVRTLETFCEKMKSMKSEFDKSSTSGCLKDSGRCRSCGRGRERPGRNRMKAKKLLIFPPEGENGPPLTLHKKSSSVNCKVKGDQDTGFRYNVIYIQRFVSSRWNPNKGTDKCCMDSG